MPTPTKAIMERKKPRMTLFRMEKYLLEKSFVIIAVP